MSSEEKIVEGFRLVLQGIGELFEEIVASISKIWNKIHWEIAVKISNDPEMKNCFSIYRRTKKARVKKKQINRIKAILLGG